MAENEKRSYSELNWELLAAHSLRHPSGKGDTGRLLESVNEASRRCRTVYLTFLLVAVYMALVVGSTTDEQLLRGSAVPLPILNVGLPIVGVYIVGPFLFLILHFNLLLNLFLLSRKLFDLSRKLGVEGSGRDHYRRLVDIFPFSQYILETHYNRRMQSLLFIVVWITVVATPMALLLWAQVRFLPYHSDGVSGWHAALLVVDIGMLWVFWPLMISDKGTVAGWWRELNGTGQRIFWAGVPAIFSIVLSYVTLFDAVVPAGWAEKNFKSPDTVNSLDWLGKKAGIKFRYLDLPEKNLVAKEAPPEILAALIGREAPPEEIEAVRLEHTKGLILTDRDLRGANFIKSRLYKADLRGAVLRDANLYEAKLQDANLSPLNPDSLKKKKQTNLRNANLQNADLRGVNLRWARLQGANLGGALLQGADLRSARLQGADLHFALLQGADLNFALLQGADLSSAGLEGADLSSARLQGADLRWAFLQGADLHSARLQGANLGGARLQGADLSEASLQDADLRDSFLDLADLSGARLQGPDAKTRREMWQKIREELEKKVPAGERRDQALERLRRAERSVTRIEPKSAENAHYELQDLAHPKIPAFALLQNWWPPSKGWNREAYNKLLVPYLVGLACKDAAIAKGITVRVDSVPGLAASLRDEACEPVAELPEKTRKLFHDRIEVERKAAAKNKAKKNPEK